MIDVDGVRTGDLCPDLVSERDELLTDRAEVKEGEHGDSGRSGRDDEGFDR